MFTFKILHTAVIKHRWPLWLDYLDNCHFIIFFFLAWFWTLCHTKKQILSSQSLRGLNNTRMNEWNNPSWSVSILLPACFPSRSHKQYKSILLWMSHSVCSSTHVFLTLISIQSIGIWTSFGSFLTHGVFQFRLLLFVYYAVVFIKQLHVLSAKLMNAYFFLSHFFGCPFYCLMFFFYAFIGERV